MVTYTTNWNIIGHEWAVAHLTAAMNAGRLGHAYLFSGPAGIGKTRFAGAFAQMICCTHPKKRPCGECRACRHIADGTYADFTMVLPDDGSMKIEQMRTLTTSLSLRPMESDYRVILIREFDQATPQAMDAFLKTLEEPPSHVVLLLTADSVQNVLPTIRSRCQPINLRLLPAGTIRQALTDGGIDAERAALLANLSGGRVGWAINAAENPASTSSRDAALRDLESVVTQSRVGRFMLADAITKDAGKDKGRLLVVLEAWQSYWRDVLLTQHHATTGLVNRDHEHAIRQVALASTNDQTTKTLATISQTMLYLDRNVNARLAFEVLLLDMPRIPPLIPPAPGT